MEMDYTNTGLWALLAATFTLAATHTVSPDHWFPFVMVGRANKWRISWVLVLATLAGLGHVGTSVAIGLVGVFAEKGLSKEIAGVLENTTPMLLIFFGFGYAAYALYKQRVGAHGHSHGIPIINKWLKIDPHAYDLPGNDHGHKHDHDHLSDHDMGVHIGKVELYLHNIELHIAVDHDDHLHGYDATTEEDHAHAHGHDKLTHEHNHRHKTRGLDGHVHGEDNHEHGDHGHDQHEDHSSRHDDHHGNSHHDQHNHGSPNANLRDKRAGWGLVAILGLTPCIALLPLTFAAVKYGTMAVISVNIVFAATTIGTILLFTWLGLLGLSWIKLDFFDEYGDIIAGGIIGLLGLATKIFEL